MTLEEIKKRLKDYGPTRVVINGAGEAVPPFRARRDYNVHPDIIFVRDDGWMLAAPIHFQEIAERMWKDEWVAVFTRGSWDPIPYDQWKEQQNAL
jgi:hypothetical protein